MAEEKNKCVIVIEDREDQNGKAAVAVTIDFAHRELPENEAEFTMAEQLGVDLLQGLCNKARTVEYVGEDQLPVGKAGDPDGSLN